MLIKRAAIAACLPATTTTDTRFFLSSVCVTPDGKVQATNGHLAIIAIDHARLEDGDFPNIEGATFAEQPTGNTLIEAVNAKALIAVMPKKSTIPVLQTCQISQRDANTITIAATDLNTRSVQRFDPTEQHGTFPSLDRVMPAADKPNTIKMRLAVEVLEAIIKGVKAGLPDTKNPIITFAVPLTADKSIAEQPAVDAPIRFNTDAGELTIEGCLMPCRMTK